MQLLSFAGMMLFLPECFSQLKAPKFVRATLGASVSVQCSYTVEYTGNKKYWCRGSGSSCRNIFEISEGNVTVRLNRSSFKDNHSLLQFTMTIDDVSKNDTGMYSCGVTVRGKKDLIAPVNITVTTRGPDVPVIELNTASKLYLIFASSQIHVPFLISMILKTPIFFWIIIAIIWMHRRCRQHSEEGKPPGMPEIPH